MHGEERWQVYQLNGDPIAGLEISSSEAHTERRDSGEAYESEQSSASSNQPVLYGVACTWLYRKSENGDIELLFQKRSPYVDRNANKWDVSGGGHINSGEDILTAAVRELREEIGASVDASELEYLFSRNDGRRIAYVFLCDYTNHPNSESDFHFDDQEVSAVRWIPLPDLPDFWQREAKRPLATDFVHYQCLMERLNKLR